MCEMTFVKCGGGWVGYKWTHQHLTPLQPDLVTCKPPYKLARVANDTALGMTTKYTFQIYSFCGRETDRLTMGSCSQMTMQSSMAMTREEPAGVTE